MRTTMAALAVADRRVRRCGAGEAGGGGRRTSRRLRRRRRRRPARRRGPRSASSGTPTTSRPSTARASRRSARGPGLPNDPAYRIADFYRSHQGGYPGTPHGWSAFWTSGYRAPRPAPFRPYRRTIGENGDLFLAVPFLAPVGPISGAFFGY